MGLVGKDMETIISVYARNGIVTRNDCVSLDSRSYARDAYKELQNRGYDEAEITEVKVKNYMDYTTIIYNSRKYNRSEVEEYAMRNVLI